MIIYRPDLEYLHLENETSKMSPHFVLMIGLLSQSAFLYGNPVQNRCSLNNIKNENVRKSKKRDEKGFYEDFFFISWISLDHLKQISSNEPKMIGFHNANFSYNLLLYILFCCLKFQFLS